MEAGKCNEPECSHSHPHQIRRHRTLTFYLHALSAHDMGYLTNYYTFGLPSFLVLVIALYLIFTGALRCPLCLTGITSGMRRSRVSVIQGLERLSTSGGFSRNQVHLRGLRWESAYASVSAP